MTSTDPDANRLLGASIRSRTCAVLCTQVGCADAAWVVASRRRILWEKEHPREQAKPHQGENTVRVLFSLKLGFQLANKSTVQSLGYATDGPWNRSWYGVFFPGDCRSPEGPLSLELFKARIWLHICDLKFCDLQRESGCFREQLRTFSPFCSTGSNRSIQTRCDVSRDTQEEIGNAERDSEGREYSGPWQDFCSQENAPAPTPDIKIKYISI